MSTATAPNPLLVHQMGNHEKEQLLTVLANDLMERAGLNFVRLKDQHGTICVMRIPEPVLLEHWPADFSPEEIAELEGRIATVDQAVPLFEFTDYCLTPNEPGSKEL